VIEPESKRPRPSPPALSPADLLRLREEFPILGRKIYLNSCSLGALSRKAESRLGEFLELWHELGASAWYEHWLDRLGELRSRVADFLGADGDELALSPSTSVALSSIAESLDWKARPRVVTTELDFPTLGYQFAVKPDVELVVLRSEDGITIHPDQFREAVDERTGVLATSHVFFITGARQDLSELARIARAAGALSLIDGYQGAGQVSLNVRDAGVDVYTSGPLKWLCGGPGLAYLYVRRDRIQALEPRITSWFAAQQPFEFDLEGFAFRGDARRFEMGTPALPTVHTALGGQEVVDSVGIGCIESRNRDLTRRLITGLEDAGFTLRVAPDLRDRTAIVMVRHPDPVGAVATLAREGIIVDHRPGHVRVSPHFYNTEEEMDEFVDALERIRTD
jgi:kynureninase